MARLENKDQTRMILELLADDYYPTKIARRLKVKRQTISEKLGKMAKLGLIKKVGSQPAFYEIKPRGKVLMLKRRDSSLPMTKSRINLTAAPFTDDKIEVHHYTIKIPIVEHGKLEKTRKVQLNNWIEEVLHEDFPIPLTISITPKNAILHLHKTELPRTPRFKDDLFEWSLQAVIYAQAYLVRHGYKLHTIRAKVISQHLASRTNERVAKEIPKENVFTVKFARKAASLTGSMPKNAAAWTDGTPDPRAIETNDLLYEEKMLMMPEKVDNIERVLMPLLMEYGRQVKGHLELIASMDRTQKEQRDTLSEIRKDLKKRSHGRP